jgi:carnitine 3-dehydrogenase
VTTQVLDSDEKRLHVFHVLLRDGAAEPLATAEHMLLHVDTGSGRAAPSGEPVRGRVAELTRRHAALPRPKRAGRSIGVT